MKKEELRKIILSDLYRYTGKISLRLYIKHYYTNPGFRYMLTLRKCQYYKNNKNKVIIYLYQRFKLRKLMLKYGFEIPFSTKIGQGFYIGHFGGIAINPSAIVGENVNISKGVTIGQSNRGLYKGSPTISDMVWIGANASIVGNIRIGNNVLIAPNAYVNRDVPDNSVVIGNPMQIIPSAGATNGYINRIID